MEFCKMLLALSEKKLGEYHKTTQCIRQVITAAEAGIIGRLEAIKIVTLLYYDEIEKIEQAED